MTCSSPALGPLYGIYDGTSFSAPIVSGIAALMLALRPNLYNDDLCHLIQVSADDKGSQGWDPFYGAGRVNAAAALGTLDPTQNTFIQMDATGTSAVTQGDLVTIDLDQVPEWAWPDEPWTAQDITVRPYEVTRSIEFPEGWFSVLPVVWGRSVATRGLDLVEDGVLHGHPWCEVIPESVDETGCTLRTWVYEVPSHATWLPCPPSEVRWAYSVYAAQATSAGIDDAPDENEEEARGDLVMSVSTEPVRRGADLHLFVPRDARVNLAIHDVLGRRMRTLLDNVVSAGHHDIQWDGDDDAGRMLPSGIYYAKVKSAGQHQIGKVLVLR
jgi:hypothetical protein